ncbi:hypothetical protein [Edaphobacter acidisoli]|nr:hypothetical protein [Edaphobacter acidisoli]
MLEKRIALERSPIHKARLLRVKYGLPPLEDGPLPAGLTYHCAACAIVVPADAPRPEGGDCEFVATHKLAWYKPEETLAGKFCMAVAAWALIYHQPLRDKAHAESVEYLRQFKHERKAHFAASAARLAMLPEHIEAERQHGRDGWLYATEAS